MTHKITAHLTDTSVEFRNFPQISVAFDPSDDVMFLPLELGLVPDSMGNFSFILLDDNDKEVYINDEWHTSYYGLSYDLKPWGKNARKLGWALIKHIREALEDENVEIVLVKN